MYEVRFISVRALVTLLIGVPAGFLAQAQATADVSYHLIEFGAPWQYLDDGETPDPEWTQVSYDASAWDTGRGEFGYGDGDETTLVGYGDDPGNKAIVTYYRHIYQIDDRASLRRTTMRMISDDGAVVYVNGLEVFRYNMPEGVVSSSTLALTELQPEATNPGPQRHEQEVVQLGLWAGYMIQGTNVISVEVHQASASTDDSSFDLELIANRPIGPPAVQFVSPTNGTILTGTVVELEVDAVDFDGHIYRVDYFSGTNKIGQSMEYPFSLTWVGTQGRHRVTALAFDYSGRRTFSDVVLLQMGEVTGDEMVRGPYLQMGSPTNILVCWRTDWLTDALVRYGTSPDLLDQSAQSTQLTTEHAVKLEGLLPNTRYYYSVNTSGQFLGGDYGYHFVTAPLTPKPTRIWVIGDSGTADFNAQFVREIYANYSWNRDTDLWLMLGDNAYESGTDDQYQAAVFDMYPEMLRQTVLWPTIGNHDAAMADPEGRIAYLDIFRLPRQGELGGLPSGTENYYAFDYSNIHFICLDSALSDREPGGAMLTWLENDLAATDKEWIIAFWHHPPYTFGSHNSDVESDLIDMRENALPILESHGVDLVLSGHSHVYERSYLLNGHYGYSTNLTSEMVLDSGWGQHDIDGPYEKPAGGLGAGQGTVYTVCGCSGEGGHFTVRQHPAMASSLSGFGCLVIDVDGDRLDLKFLNGFGTISDYFSITKGLPASGVFPRLKIKRVEDQTWVSWPTSLVPYRLESVGHLDGSWVPWPLSPTTYGRSHRAPIDSSLGQRMFRLKGD